MSEFKFACSICGQHITTDSSASGRQIQCPTCYQKIVVPQAPASTDTKLLLSAPPANPRRPDMPPTRRRSRPRRKLSAWKLLAVLGAWLLLFCAGAAVVLHYRSQILRTAPATESQNALPDR